MTGSSFDVGDFGRDDASFLGPVEVRNTAEVIADRLVTAIALGEFVPGQRLPSERDLAEMLQVSRTTVREALQRLSSAGFVEARRGRNGGAFVQSSWQKSSAEMINRALAPNRERLEHVLDFRDQIEPLIARLAAERRSDDDVAAMHEALDAYDNASDRESSRAADETLHTVIARATGNPYFVGLRRRLHAEVSFGGNRAEPFSQDVRRRAIGHHRDLVAAIEDGDGTRAADIAGEHFALTRELVTGLLERIRAEVDPGEPTQ